jgi:uncharacterized protein YerC
MSQSPNKRDVLNAAEAQAADARHAAIINALKDGRTLRDIAQEHGLVFQRIGQIAQRARRRGLLPTPETR